MALVPAPGPVLEVGCGNGHTARRLHELGYDVVGVEASESGVECAKKVLPGGRFEVATAYEDLAGRFGSFPAIVSVEVVEHLYDPKLFAQRVFRALAPGGVAIVTTPFHGYAKNLAIALLGRADRHFDPLWDHGHIKFFSEKTLGTLLTGAGFVQPDFYRVGRVPALAKSMVAVARRPAH